MLYVIKFAICCQINIKHINTVWQNVKFWKDKPVGASLNQ
jgi:hypothetical protein